MKSRPISKFTMHVDSAGLLRQFLPLVLSVSPFAILLYNVTDTVRFFLPGIVIVPTESSNGGIFRTLTCTYSSHNPETELGRSSN